MNIYSVGDVIQLKSGRPPMTIVQIPESTPNIQVGWFSGTEWKETWLPSEALMLYTFQSTSTATA